MVDIDKAATEAWNGLSQFSFPWHDCIPLIRRLDVLEKAMPTISWFYGISIRMFFNDHAPPHFHASIGGDEAIVAISTGEILRGRLPRVAQRLVQDWALRYNSALMANWDHARQGERQPMERIPGLDQDDD